MYTAVSEINISFAFSSSAAGQALTLDLFGPHVSCWGKNQQINGWILCCANNIYTHTHTL